MIVDDTVTTCGQVDASVTPLVGMDFRGSVDAGLTPLQSDLQYVTWNTAETPPPDSYTLVTNPPAGYALQVACWKSTPLPLTLGTGLSAVLIANETITWDLGYSLGSPWPQAVGGDVYAGTELVSFVPDTITPRVFVENGVDDGSGGFPGLVTYGGTYDLDSEAGLGEAYVSSKEWIAGDDFPNENYYNIFVDSFDLDITDVDYGNPDNTVTQPGGTGERTYYATGNVTTSGAWNIAAGNKLIFFVNGNLSIGDRITVAEGGFIAFIVSGNITVDDTVGTAWNDDTPLVEGVYIANGAFDTGYNNTAGIQRFVGGGTFVANSFTLRRNIRTNNVNAAAELFVYNPRYLIEMPDGLKNTNVTWQEVAP